MAKSTSQLQAAFSFFDEVEKTEPAPKPKRNTLRPPEIIEANEQEVIADTEPVLNTTKAVAGETIEEAEPEAIVETVEEVAENEVEIESKVEEIVEAVEEDSDEIIEEENEEAREIALEGEVQEVKDAAAHQKELKTKEDNEPKPVIKKPTGTRGRRSVKENSLAAEMIELPDDEELFKKQYYSMGEVTTMFNENHSLIRYWESEFDILKPKKNGKGDRFFRPVDVKNLYLIYDLLRRRKFTIDGAREYLKNDKKAEERFAAVQSLQKMKSFFLELKATL